MRKINSAVFNGPFTDSFSHLHYNVIEGEGEVILEKSLFRPKIGNCKREIKRVGVKRDIKNFSPKPKLPVTKDEKYAISQSQVRANTRITCAKRGKTTVREIHDRHEILAHDFLARVRRTKPTQTPKRIIFELSVEIRMNIKINNACIAMTF